jgi:hypothetical protein
MTVIINGTSGLTFNDASTQNTAATGFGFKNRIINGNMTISQRNGTSSVTPTNSVYTLDRWNTNLTQASKFSVQQDAGGVTPPAGFTDYLGVTSLSSYSVTSTDFFSVLQSIEGFNTADLAWGTASASPVTISFWVRSSLTGTFGGSLNNGSFNRAYPFTYTISAANTWEQKSFTVAGDTTGTWATGNTTGIHLYFNLGAGSSFSGTAGAWASSGVVSATGATSVVGTSGATFYITGVQLEKGSTATSFDYRPYGTELVLCQRYYQRYVAGNSGFGSFGYGRQTSTTLSRLFVFYPEMRANPTLAINNSVALDIPNGSLTYTSINNQYCSVAGGFYDVNHSSGGSTGASVALQLSSNGQATLSAEL